MVRSLRIVVEAWKFRKMINRKAMGKASPIFLILLALGFFFATYNLLTLVLHNQNRETGEEMIGAHSADPVVQIPDEFKKSTGPRRPFHVALTATDAPYSKWQCRIMYYWYKKMKVMEGAEMGGFTRVLHSGNPDELMGEIPTFVVNPLPAGMDRVRIVTLEVGFHYSLIIGFCYWLAFKLHYFHT